MGLPSPSYMRLWPPWNYSVFIEIESGHCSVDLKISCAQSFIYFHEWSPVLIGHTFYFWAYSLCFTVIFIKMPYISSIQFKKRDKDGSYKATNSALNWKDQKITIEAKVLSGAFELTGACWMYVFGIYTWYILCKYACMYEYFYMSEHYTVVVLNN